jgi:hypothetical protein
LETLNGIWRERFNVRVEPFKADRPNLVNHDIIGFPIRGHPETKRPVPELGCHRADNRHLCLMHVVGADDHARTALLLFVPFAGRIKVNPINAKPNSG